MPTAPALERKQLSLSDLQFSTADAGSFRGRASAFNGVDSYGDTIVPGAYKDTLPKFLADGFIAWGHDDLTPVAYPTAAREEADGLWVEATFHSTPAAQEARRITQERAAAGKRTGLSIGYFPVKAESGPDGTRRLLAIDLVEVSIVLVPADDAARVAEVKAAAPAILKDHLAALRKLLPDMPADVADQMRTHLDAMGKMMDGGMAMGMMQPHLDAMRKLLADMPSDVAAQCRALLDKMSALKANGAVRDTKAAVGVHHTDTSTAAWDGPANTARAKTDQPASYFRQIFAWQDPQGDAAKKDAWRFIHHEVNADGTPGPANMKACATLIGVLNGGRGVDVSAQPWAKDRAGIHAHVAAHMKDGNMEPPPLKSLDDFDTKDGDCGYGSPWGEHTATVIDAISTARQETEAFYLRAFAQDQLERKEGRTLSAATRAQLQQVLDAEESLGAAFSVIKQLLADTAPPPKGWDYRLNLRETESRLRLAGIV